MNRIGFKTLFLLFRSNIYVETLENRSFRYEDFLRIRKKYVENRNWLNLENKTDEDRYDKYISTRYFMFYKDSINICGARVTESTLSESLSFEMFEDHSDIKLLDMEVLDVTRLVFDDDYSDRVSRKLAVLFVMKILILTYEKVKTPFLFTIDKSFLSFLRRNNVNLEIIHSTENMFLVLLNNEKLPSQNLLSQKVLKVYNRLKVVVV